MGLRVLFEDDFNRTDGLLQSPWKTGTTHLRISGNTIMDGDVVLPGTATFTQDWSQPDANPWTSPLFTITDEDGVKVSNGGLRPVGGYRLIRVIYNGAIESGLTKQVEIKFAQDEPTYYDHGGPAFVNPTDGSGYWLKFGDYTNTRVVKVSSSGTETAIAASFFPNLGYTTEDSVTFTMTDAGVMTVYFNDVQVSQFTDTTYDAADLQPSVMFLRNNINVFGIAEFKTVTSSASSGDLTRKSYYDQITDRGQWAEAQVAVVGPPGDVISPSIHMDALGTQRYSADTQSDQIRLAKVTNSIKAYIGAPHLHTLVPSDVVRITSDDSNVEVFLNDVSIISEDDTALSGGYPALNATTLSGTAVIALDNFRAGLLGEPAVLTNPTATATGETTASGSVQYDVPCCFVYGYVSQSATPPSEADHISGNGADAWQADADVQDFYSGFNWSGLVEGTTYYAHYLHIRDQLTSAQATSSAFTTSTAAQTPVLTNPSGTATGLNTATGTVDCSLTGGSVWCLTNTSPVTPGVLEVKASSFIVSAVQGTVSFNITGLEEDTTYYNHYVQTTGGISSSVVTSPSFKTDAVVVPPGPGPICDPFSMVVNSVAISTLLNTSTDKTSFTITWQSNVAVGNSYVSLRTTNVYTDDDAADIKSGLGAVAGPFSQPAVLGTNSITITDVSSGVTYYPGVVQEY